MSLFDHQPGTTPTDQKNKSLFTGLKKSRDVLGGLGSLLRGRTTLDDNIYDEILDMLLTADVGVNASQRIIEQSRIQADAKRVSRNEELISILRTQMLETLAPCSKLPQIDAQPYVIMVVGVNGVGKTTTVAKIAAAMHAEGRKVVLAAADTFRAAAIEQLQHWGKRFDIPVVAQGSGADAAAVAHDALASAKASGADIVLVDTAGRQHTQQDLMAQLSKVKRVLTKIDAQAPHEIMQILDASTGQNALSQFKHFEQAVGVDTLSITKLDGTAKGGVLLALAERTARPVRYIGVGERASDLLPFDPEAFIDALLPGSLTT